jgi:hypothetical protein
MAAMEKVYSCLTCNQDIRLERKDNHWLKWNLDNTSHVCNSSKKKKAQEEQQQQKQLPRSELTDLQDQVTDLQAYIKTLVTQVQLLRQEVQQIKR